MTARPKMQAKDLDDAVTLAALAACRGKHGVAAWSSRWDVQDEIKHAPPKVVLAKLRSMIKRGVLSGCACGCRGDFHLPGAS